LHSAAENRYFVNAKLFCSKEWVEAIAVEANYHVEKFLNVRGGDIQVRISITALENRN
jgi:hypothetical protein